MSIRCEDDEADLQSGAGRGRAHSGSRSPRHVEEAPRDPPAPAAGARHADAGPVEERWEGVWFEVRIQKRRGKRSADTARWNELGRDGWELVAVDGKHAFFRREHRLT